MIKLYRTRRFIVFVRSGKFEATELLGVNKYIGCKWLRFKVIRVD